VQNELGNCRARPSTTFSQTFASMMASESVLKTFKMERFSVLFRNDGAFPNGLIDQRRSASEKLNGLLIGFSSLDG
jgi:hypothetical protein